jgi:chemotaxis response regulator CheB
MPGGFTSSYAERLNQLSDLNVKDADNEASVEKMCIFSE